MKRRGAIAGAGAALVAVRRAGAQALPSITYGTVSSAAFDWPELVAAQLGFYTANGVNVDVVRTGQMAANAQQLAAGSLDVAEISSTQLIEAIQGGAPLVAVGEHVATAPYFVLGKKGLTSVAQLKGKTIVVGGTNDITRVFMDKVLAGARLGPDDYTYTFAGSTDARFAALINGGVDAAILSPPISTRAAEQGFPVLEEVAKYFPAFFFDAFAVRPDWARQHRELVLAFLRGHLQGVAWLADPANRVRAIQILSAGTNTSVDDAAKSYDLLVTKLHAFAPTGIMKDADVAVVLDALSRMGQLKAPLPPASRFYDNTYTAQAFAQVRDRQRPRR